MVKISCIGNNSELPYITSKLPGPYLGFESNFHIFLCPVFDVSENILVQSDQGSDVRKMIFAASVQGTLRVPYWSPEIKPLKGKSYKTIKIAKTPQNSFK